MSKDTIYRQDAIELALEYFVEYLGGAFDENGQKELMARFQRLPSAQSKKEYTKADYIMALHKEYGCELKRAEKAHDKALEYLRNTAIIKG